MDSLVSNIQAEHKQWAEYNFGEISTAESLIGMSEELGELSHAYLKKRQNIRTNEDHEENMRDAIGDLLIYLLGFCNSKGYDASEILEKTWDSVKQRDWVNFPHNGMTE